MIYHIEDISEVTSSHIDNRIRKGDILLCLEHTGDCHYTWALLDELDGNDTTRYFRIEKIYSSYGIEGTELLDEPLVNNKLLSAVISIHLKGRSAVLVPKLQKEIFQLQNIPCPFCGLEKNKNSDWDGTDY